MPLIKYSQFPYCDFHDGVSCWQQLVRVRQARKISVERQSRGYALFEALIAVLVASIGFIGAARLQTLGMKMNTSAQFRQKAVLLTYQMSDRVRANRAGFGAGAYDRAAIGSKVCLGIGCTPEELAVADMTEWSEDIMGQLQGGSGVVCVDSTPNDGVSGAPACDGVGTMLIIKIWWSDSLGDSRFVAEIRP